MTPLIPLKPCRSAARKNGLLYVERHAPCVVVSFSFISYSFLCSVKKQRNRLNHHRRRHPGVVASSDNCTFDRRDETTMQSIIELETSSNTNESWEECTTEHVSADSNVTTITPSISTCPPAVTPEMLDAAKREIIDSITSAISRHIGDRLDALEARLSMLSCSSAPTSPPVRLAWQIYENLQVPLHGWLRVFDQPYSHRTRTRTDDLSQLSGICHNDVLVAASFNNSISLAAVGPASVLTLNTAWNRPQLVGQVYWYQTVLFLRQTLVEYPAVSNCIGKFLRCFFHIKLPNLFKIITYVC